MVFSKINKEYTQIKMIDDVCSICLDEFKETNICKTECGHVFHLTCLLTHYDNKCKTLDCPMCRKELHEKKQNNNIINNINITNRFERYNNITITNSTEDMINNTMNEINIQNNVQNNVEWIQQNDSTFNDFVNVVASNFNIEEMNQPTYYDYNTYNPFTLYVPTDSEPTNIDVVT
jgi:hypothetical protein